MKENNQESRVIARSFATELTVEEQKQVTGGACQTEIKATWSESSGADAEASLVCKF